MGRLDEKVLNLKIPVSSSLIRKSIIESKCPKDDKFTLGGGVFKMEITFDDEVLRGEAYITKIPSTSEVREDGKRMCDVIFVI